jgi:hypothetical protein
VSGNKQMTLGIARVLCGYPRQNLAHAKS